LADKIPLIRPDPEDIDQWVDTSEEQNLQLLAARSATEIARQEIDRQRSGHYPTLDLVLSHDYDDTGGGFFASREIETNQIGLQLEVPLYQGGLVSSQVREARERFDQARELQEQQRRAVVRQTRDAYLGVVASISRVTALKQAVVSAESALEATEAGYEVGTRTIVDVLAVQRNLFGSLRDFARGRYDYIIVSLQLKQGAGILSADDLVQVNSWLK
jgi:outer membrane protein